MRGMMPIELTPHPIYVIATPSPYDTKKLNQTNSMLGSRHKIHTRDKFISEVSSRRAHFPRQMCACGPLDRCPVSFRPASTVEPLIFVRVALIRAQERPYMILLFPHTPRRVSSKHAPGWLTLLHLPSHVFTHLSRKRKSSPMTYRPRPTYQKGQTQS